ncbi:MAG: P-type ATPase [Thermoproteota archaeon]
MLLAAIAISAILGWLEAQASAEPKTVMETYVDAITIGVIVFLNAVVGFIQEYRSEKAVEAMRKLAAPNTRVLRGRHEVIIPAREIVPDDILLFESGDRIAADGRLIDVVDLSVDESVLTGESNPVNKDLNIAD